MRFPCFFFHVGWWRPKDARTRARVRAHLRACIKKIEMAARAVVTSNFGIWFSPIGVWGSSRHPKGARTRAPTGAFARVARSVIVVVVEMRWPPLMRGNLD